MSADGSGLAVIEHSPRGNGLAGIRVVHDVIPVLDTGRFEHMQRIATVMAAMSLVPESLRAIKDGGLWEPLPRETVVANCFLVVNQATRWGMDPFAVVACCSVVHGRLTYEGKLVAAVLDAKIGIRLSYKWTGEGEAMTIEVSGTLPDGRVEAVTGSVRDWRTTGNRTPWTPSAYRRMLAYRGAREWARLYAPAVMLGVYSDDEMDGLTRTAHELRVEPPRPPPASTASRPLTIEARATPAPAPAQGGRTLRPPSPPSMPPPATPAPAPAQGGRTLRPPSPPSMPPPASTATAPAAVPPPARPGQIDARSGTDAPIDGAAVLDHIADEIGCCGDMETLDEAWAGFEDLIGRLGRSDRLKAESLYEQQAGRLGKG